MNRIHQDNQPNFVERMLLKTFGKPEGLLGRIGGYILAMGKREPIAWFIDLLNVRSHERVLRSALGRGLPFPRCRSRRLMRPVWTFPM